MLRLTRMELGTAPEVRFWMDEAGGGDFYCRCCCGRDFVAGFRVYHAGGGVFCSYCSSRILLPRETCSQKKSGEIQRARFPPFGVGDC